MNNTPEFTTKAKKNININTAENYKENPNFFLSLINGSHRETQNRINTHTHTNTELISDDNQKKNIRIVVNIDSRLCVCETPKFRNSS